MPSVRKIVKDKLFSGLTFLEWSPTIPPSHIASKGAERVTVNGAVKGGYDTA
ncbi:MAG: hypothetical protein ACLPX5_03785 [Dissulfurispiraceae bacterium]